jgi:hypothetical protein
MRYEVVLSVGDLRLSPSDSRKLIKVIQGINGFDTVIIKTGSEFDSNIEDDGEDTETMFSEIVFFVDGNVENASPIAYEVMNQIETMFDVPKKRIVLTMTEIENIIFFID